MPSGGTWSGIAACSDVLVFALSFKLSTLTDDLGDDLDGLSATFREQFEADTTTYSILMVVAILGGVLLFVLMAPFEMARIGRQVTHPQLAPHSQLFTAASTPPSHASCRLNSRTPQGPCCSAR